MRCSVAVAVSPKRDIVAMASEKGGCLLFDMLLNRVLTRIPSDRVQLLWLPSSTGVVMITEDGRASLCQLGNCIAPTIA